MTGRRSGHGPLLVVGLDVVLLAAVLVSAPVGYAWLDASRPSTLAAPSGSASPSPTAVPTATAAIPTGPSPTASPTARLVYGNGTWARTMTLPQPLWGAAAATLPDGRVLLVGGTTGPDSTKAMSATALFDPRSDYWALGAPMLEARAYPMVVVLRDGSILVAGGSRNGQPLASVERYYPDGQTWVSAGTMSSPRTYGTATLLADGRVLLAGGGSQALPGAGTTSTADIYDPESGRLTPAASMSTARAEHTATLLPNGNVLVAGGATAYAGNRGSVMSSAEIYDPIADRWRAAASMSVARYHHFAAALPNGRVLVAGGWSYTKNTDPSLATAEIYDPASNTWAATGSMARGRARGRCVTLPDGRILVVGGVDPRYDVMSTTELYVPAAGGWRPAGRLATAVVWPALAVLRDGRVLAAGGGLEALAAHVTSAASLYTPQRPTG